MTLPKTKEEAVAVAHQVIARVRDMKVLRQKLTEDGTLARRLAGTVGGLECAETSRLELLAAMNAGSALVLAEWIVEEHGT